MASLYYLVIRGTFVIIGKEPDGDSVRFIATDPDLFEELQRGYRVRLSSDGSVQLRFEGIDAPEVHYGSAAQPLGTDARDQLLAMMGFQNVQFEPGRPNRVSVSDPDRVPGVVLAQMAEANGRPVSYILLGGDADRISRRTDYVRVTDALLRKTVNYRLVEAGQVYYTVYTSTPFRHRRLLRQAALQARTAQRGVWAQDRTKEFLLVDQSSINVAGQLILPKLFRRCTDYLKAVAKGFDGNLTDWMVEVSKSRSRSENDLVLINDTIEVTFADLILQRNRTIAFQGDLLDITFIEK